MVKVTTPLLIELFQRTYKYLLKEEPLTPRNDRKLKDIYLYRKRCNAIFELIKNNAESDGFKTLSSYIRKKILDDNKIYERLINEIFSKLDKK